MAIQLHQWTAVLYLLAGLVAWVGMALRAPRLERASVGLLLLGVVTHVAAFSVLHKLDPPPPLTDLPAALSFMACVGTLFFLGLMHWLRLSGLAVLVAPLSFVSVFFASTRLPVAGPASFGGSGSWPHAHVLLGSAGIALLSLSGLAGMIFLAEHRRLKSKRPAARRRFPLPSLEALDRVNRLALAAGFPLLTLGLVTGMIWVNSVSGTFWSGTYHETLLAIAWIMYTVLTAARFGASQGSRQAAVCAVGAFAFLFFAVIGVELFL
jgi:ABC-type transport system involved in cytochrome c biogenesis permease subunit